jgi:hypothetical protein
MSGIARDGVRWLAVEVDGAKSALGKATRVALKLREELEEGRRWGRGDQRPEIIQRELAEIIADTERTNDVLTRVSSALWQGAEFSMNPDQVLNLALAIAMASLFLLFSR